jgi:DNA-binding response OmpR family regulator
MKKSILIIEDDFIIQESLLVMLSRIGYEVETATTAIDGLQKGYSLKPDLIILDVMLPGMDGWQLCERFREMSKVPIIMLTALGGEDDIVKGLGLGADDYLIKPVTMAILAAKVKAVLRRAYNENGPSINERKNALEYEGLMIDFDKHEVTLSEKRVDLSPTEFKLLSYLMRYKSRALSKEFLLTQVWGPEYAGEPDHLRLYISYLRKKIEENPARPKFIQNVWGVGYRLG